MLDVALYLAGRMRAQFRNVASSALLGVTLNILLVPQFGVRGAVVSSVVAQAVAATMSWWSGRDVVRWRVPVAQLGRLGLCCALLATGAYVFAADGIADLIASVFVGATVYAVSMFMTNAAGCRDWIVETRRARVQ